jgi:hypothetical protein
MWTEALALEIMRMAFFEVSRCGSGQIEKSS